MKRFLWLTILSLIILGIGCVIYVPYVRDWDPERPGEYEEQEYYDEYPEDLDVSYFYELLSHHGIWTNYSPYGYVWVPHHLGYRWKPYTRGSWIWTNHGWTWLSDFSWGWAPFHYGRWSWDREFGWFWVPDTVWGPAWVTWRYSDLYIGWAPLPPEVEFMYSEGIHSLPFELPGDFWIFVEAPFFMDSYIYRYMLPWERNVTIIGYTSPVTHIYVENYMVINRGIDIDRIRRIAKRDISRYELQDSDRPGLSRIRMDGVEIYRPSVRKDQLAKPGRVVHREEVSTRVSKEKLEAAEQRLQKPEAEEKMREEHEHEVRLLNRSQEAEEKELDRKKEEEKKVVQDPEEKKKVEKEYSSKKSTLKKKHDEEKSELKKRQEKEKKKVTKKKIKK
jgi:hypothetical protein